MNVPVNESDGFVAAVSRVRRAVMLAERRGEGAGMPKLLDALDTLGRPGTLPASRSPLAGLIAAVHASLVSAIVTGLHQRARTRLVAELRSTCRDDEFIDDPWGEVDGSVAVARMERIHALRRQAATRAIRAVDHYVRDRRTSFLRDAVRVLQTSRDAETRVAGSRLTASNCDAEMERLGTALRSSMPPWAWAFFSLSLEADVRSSLTASGVRLTPAMARRLDMWFRQGSWDMPAPIDRPVCRGRWFGQPLDSAFRQFLQEKRKVRAAEAAKGTEKQRKIEEWNARRASEREEAARLVSQDADDVTPPVKEGGAQVGKGSKASPDHDDGYELVQLPDGPKRMTSAMAAAVRETLAQQEQQDRMAAEAEEVRRSHYERIGKRYEPPPPRYLL